MKRRTLFFVLIGMLLGACAPVPPATPAVPAIPAATATQSAPAPAPATAVLPPTTVPTAAAPASPTAAPAVAASALPTTGPAVTATVPPAAQAATPAVEGNRSVAFGGVGFTYSAGLAQGAEGKTVPAEAGGAGAPWWVPVPAHVEIDLTGYVLTDTLHAPSVIVYPAAEFAQSNQAAQARIAALQQMLAGKPPEPDGDAGELPFLPLFNAAQQMHVGVEYLAFQGGQGVRYLTQYAQGLMPLNNHELIYTFQGLTADGKFYVAALLPVSHPALPASALSLSGADRAALEADFGAYLQKQIDSLSGQPGAAFTPDLRDLDALVASIAISDQ